MRIFLFRHGLPSFDHSIMIEPDGLHHVLNEYSESVVTEPPCYEISALEMLTKDYIVVSSELPRARSSASILGFAQVVTSSNLNEANLPHPDTLPCRLPWRLILILCRTAWLLGYQRNAPGIQKDKEQAKKATAWLIDQARTHDDVVVFGHGVMLRLISKNLETDGWRTEMNSGSGYWSCRVMSYTCHEMQQ